LAGIARLVDIARLVGRRRLDDLSFDPHSCGLPPQGGLAAFATVDPSKLTPWRWVRIERDVAPLVTGVLAMPTGGASLASISTGLEGAEALSGFPVILSVGWEVLMPLS
jgi:hypothetical protein